MRGSLVASRSKHATYSVATRRVSGLGTILVNGKGQALYVFDKDHHSGHSTCTSECAVEWPPLLLPSGVTKPVAAGGAKASLLGTTRRSGGTLQVTYGGWPLYRFALDTSPGDVSGQGLNNLGGLWYVLSPKGKEIH
jgi:predicted lipoprotein with Yx(FWY)xxD motif